MIVAATTLCAFAMDDPGVWGSWLTHAEAISASHDDGVIWFAAIETDARGLVPFGPLLERLAELPSDHWTFSLDDGRTEVTTANRIRHITMGQNLATDYAVSVGASHLLFLAADLCPPPDVLPKLLEMDHPLVGMEIPTYCLEGPDVAWFPFPVQEHMASAAGVLIARDVFRYLRWRGDAEQGFTDDPAYHNDAIELLGVPTYVRKDCVGRHYPESIPAIERRGYDLRVER